MLELREPRSRELYFICNIFFYNILLWCHLIELMYSFYIMIAQ